MKHLLILLLITVAVYHGYCQNDSDYLAWSASHRLTVDDFGIKKNGSQAGLTFAQFNWNYSLKGFDFMTKNFNNKVVNTMVKSASWIDTTESVNLSLRYQQSLFDLSEIYVRRFRRDLKENRKQIIKGVAIAEELNSKNSSDFAKRRLLYDEETNYGRNEEQQLMWEQKINEELNELADYEYGVK